MSRQKAPGSFVAGCANMFIFPELDSGSLAYKLVQRLAGATATGPIVIELSRGATADDIVDGAAVGILQSVASDAS